MKISDNKTIIISFTEGNVIRNYFNQGLLEYLQQAGFNIVFFTPAERVPYFVENYRKQNIDVFPLPFYKPTVWELRGEKARKKIGKYSKRFESWVRSKEHLLYSNLPYYKEQLKRLQPAMMLFTNPMYRHEISLFMAAKSMKIKNIGLLRSWDNLHMGLKFFPDKLLVWNQVNAEEASHLMGYRQEHVKIVGPCQMDPYFKHENLWSKEEFCRHLKLDPSRPIITLATIGKLMPGFDENYIADQLVELIKERCIPGDPQLIIRLHPVSRYEEFVRYTDIPFVRISHVRGHIPTLGWTMNKNEVIEVANILKHSDVLVSPGSTITIEAAIFDTPTIFPVYHHYQPELGAYFYNTILKMHHMRLQNLDLVPFIHEKKYLLPAILKCLQEPGWYRNQRKLLVEDYVYFTDGCSTKRLAQYLINHAN